MAARTRTLAQVQYERAEAYRLYQTGLTQQQIGDLLGISRSQAGYDIRAQKQEMHKAALQLFHNWMMGKIAELDAEEAVHWQKWEESKRPRKRKKVGDDVEALPGARRRARVDEEERPGSPRHLAAILRISDKRVKLLRLAGR